MNHQRLSAMTLALLTIFAVSGCRFIRPSAVESFPGVLNHPGSESPSPLVAIPAPPAISSKTLDGRDDPFLSLPEEFVALEGVPSEYPSFIAPSSQENLSPTSSVNLRGIVLGDPPLAYIDDGSGALRRIILGDEVMGGRVAIIGDGYIVIREANNQEFTLRLEESP